MQLPLGALGTPDPSTSDLVASVRLDFADLAESDRHRGLAEAAIAAATLAACYLSEGSTATARALRELRDTYAQADEVRGRELASTRIDPIAELLATLPDTPADLT